MSKRKSLVFFSHLAVPTHLTGAELYLLTILEKLAASASFRCTLVCPGNSLLEKEAQKIGADTLIHPFPMLWEMWKPTKNIKKKQKQLERHPSVVAISKLLHTLKADVVITNSCINVLPALAASRTGLPVHWIVHETIRKNPYTEEAIAFLVQHSTQLIGVSKTVLAPFYRKNCEPILLYPFSKHLDETINEKRKRRNFRKPQQIADETIIVGFAAAQLTKEKGLDDVLSIAKSLSDENVLFLMVGHLPKHERIKQANMRHLAYIDDMVSFYCSIDLLLVPSLIDEGFPLTALEASFYGKPVIAYRSGGLIEQLESLHNREYLVEKGDRTVLLEKVSELIDSRALRTEIGDKLRQKSRQLYGEKAFLQRLNDWQILL